MADSTPKLTANFRDGVIKVGAIRISDATSRSTTDYAEVLVGDGVPSGAYGRDSDASMVYIRKDAPSVNALIYLTHDGGTAWTAMSSASVGSIADTNTYYTTDTIDGALDALGVQLGGDTDATFNFTEANVLADDDAVYAALEKLDLKWGDLASTANTEGAALVGVEDSGAYFTGATVEAVLAELAPKEVADPGNAGAIPVTAYDGIVHLVSAGAETRTVADPTKVGQKLLLYFLTDGGDVVVTFASPVNQAGNNTLTLADAGEAVLYVAARDGGAAFHWHVVGEDLTNGAHSTV